MATAQRGGSLRSVPGASAARWTARFALAGIIGSAFFVVALSAMHFLRPNDIVLYGNTIGFYSVGTYGSISVAASIALGLCALALAFGLRLAVSPSPLTMRPFGSPNLRTTGWAIKGVGRYA
jgi:hypothetical protein